MTCIDSGPPMSRGTAPARPDGKAPSPPVTSPPAPRVLSIGGPSRSGKTLALTCLRR
jgi:hypothetical protein